jgi:hypothetical protein
VHWAPGIPHALCFQGEEFMHDSGASRRGIAKVRPSLRGANGSRECAPDDRLGDEAIQTFFAARWIASRSLPSGGAFAPTRWLAMTASIVWAV